VQAIFRRRSRRVESDQLEGCFFFPCFAHLARAAFRALALRCSGVILAALVFPPFAPPIFPKATAFGFFLCMAQQLLCLPGSGKSSKNKHLTMR